MTEKKKNRTTEIRARVTIEEKKQIEALAKNYGLSLSEYLRQAALTQEIRHRTELTTIRELSKINADQARLGNLLKLAIDSGCDDVAIHRLVKDIFFIQKDIKEAVIRL